MKARLAFLELQSYLAMYGQEGVTDKLRGLLESHGMVQFDFSEGSGTVLVWRGFIGKDLIELLAVSPDGPPFDFTLRRLRPVETEEFRFGGVR